MYLVDGEPPPFYGAVCASEPAIGSLAFAGVPMASRPVNQLTAYWTSCVPVLRFSLRLIRCRCDSTVLMLKLSECAVSRRAHALADHVQDLQLAVAQRSMGLAEMYEPPAANF